MKHPHVTRIRALRLFSIGLAAGAVSLLVGTATPQPARALCSTPNPNIGIGTASITIPSTGTYRVWSRIMTTNTTNDSYFLEIDNSCYVVGDRSQAAGQWTWVDFQNGNAATKINAQLNAGGHSIRMIGREAGLKIDRLLFVADQSCVPVGVGDNCVVTQPENPPTNTNGQVVTPFRMNVGGGVYKDKYGVIWTADSYVTGGETDKQAAGKAIANADGEDELYRDERWGMSGYSIPVANGTYTLALHFAEIYPACNKAGCRVFSVTAEGKPLLNDFDIVKVAGAQYKANVQIFTVTVADGKLDIGFSAKTNAASLTGLQILPASTQGNGSGTGSPGNGSAGTGTVYDNKILVKPSGSAYYVQGGKSHQIGNVPIRNCIAGRRSTGPDIKVTDAELNKYQAAEAAHCPYEDTPGANFVREANSSTVWLVMSGLQKKHASVLCTTQPDTTPILKYRVWVVPEGETAGHKNVGVFKGTPETCAALPG